MHNKRTALRICLSNYRGNPHCGGQGVYIAALSRALVDAGHQVTVVTGQPWPELDARVKMVRLPTLNLADAPSKLAAFQWSWLRDSTDRKEFFKSLAGAFPDPECFAERFVRWLEPRIDDFDLVHDNQTLAHGLLKVQKMLPLVHTIHHPIYKDLSLALANTDSFFMRLLLKRWYSFLGMQTAVAKKAKHIIAPSSSAKRDMVADFGLKEDAVTVVPLGVDQRDFHPKPEVARHPLQLISTVSADAPMKGMKYLLHAASLLRQRHPGLRVKIAGKPQRHGGSRRLVAELGLQDTVTFFHGLSRPELCALYAESSVAVVPSLYEGFCLPAIEAMACAVPLVATRVGAIPEVAGEAALLVPPADPGAIANAVDRLFAENQLRQQLVEAGRRAVHTRYDWERVAIAHLQVYMDAIRSHEIQTDRPLTLLSSDA